MSRSTMWSRTDLQVIKMTTGELIFTCGLGLLGLTVLLAILFLVKKPRYTPENAIYSDRVTSETQRLRNGYPTDPLTVRRTSSRKTAPVKETESTATLPLSQETECLEDETVLLQEGSAGTDETVLLEQRTEALTGEKTAGL